MISRARRPNRFLTLAAALVAGFCTAALALGSSNGREAEAIVRLAAGPKNLASARTPASVGGQRAGERLPNDPFWADAWSLARIGAPAAWAATTGSPATVVAVIDTGIDVRHPDLQGAVLAGVDLVEDDADPSDDHGHGTAVAGLIAARSDNNLGIASLCWRCSLLPVKVIAADGRGTADDAAAGIVWAAEHGADVINISFVLAEDTSSVRAAILAAQERGVLVVAAAGNGGHSQPAYPAAYPGVIAVAATGASDDLLAGSSFGSWVSVAAPGCNVTTSIGGGYGPSCGTSMATALVSGLAGLVRSSAPDASAETVKTLLETSAARVGGFVSAGRVDAAAALAALDLMRARPVRRTGRWSVHGPFPGLGAAGLITG